MVYASEDFYLHKNRVKLSVRTDDNRIAMTIESVGCTKWLTCFAIHVNITVGIRVVVLRSLLPPPQRIARQSARQC